MPILNGGGGKSSPSLIEYNFSEGKEFLLSDSPQQIVEDAGGKTQRSFWAYFEAPTLLAGKEDMVGAIRLPAKSCFEWSDLGGASSGWWAASSFGGKAKAYVQIKSNQSNQGDRATPEPISIFQYAEGGGIFTAANKTFLKYTGQKNAETISITNNTLNYINSNVPINYVYVQCAVREYSSPEEGKLNYENIIEIKGGQTIQFTWNTGLFPYLCVVFNDGEWRAFGILDFLGTNVQFSEYLVY